MQKWTAVVLALLASASVAAVVVWAGPAAPPEPVALVADAGAPSDAAVAADETDAEADPDPDPAEGPADPESPFEAPAASDAGATLLSGEAAPALAETAPKSVVFGAVLVAYRGAQGAPAKARTRDAALTLARSLATEAQTDFKAAVGKGDKGSIANAGRIPRGVFEPAPEYVLFSLAKGEVSEPVDSPRGYLVFQRIE